MRAKKPDYQGEFGNQNTLQLLNKVGVILSCRWEQISLFTRWCGDPAAEDFTSSDLGKCPVEVIYLQV